MTARRALVGLLAIAVLASLAWYGLKRRATAPRSVAAAADSASAGVKAMRLFFGAANGDSLVGEPREMIELDGLHDRVAALVTELDRGPRGRGVAVLPAGTSVLHVYVDDRGLMTLDLSGAFRQRFRGGSSAEYMAVASLMRTLGFSRATIAGMVLSENAALLIVGLFSACFSALVAVAPVIAAQPTAIPWRSIAVTLAAVFLTGIAAGVAALVPALRGSAVMALRAE